MAGIASDWMSVGRLKNNILRCNFITSFCTFFLFLEEKLFEMHRFWVKKVKKGNLQSMSVSARPSSGSTPSSSKAVIFYSLFFEEVFFVFQSNNKQQEA
jgi:hypothetical protein